MRPSATVKSFRLSFSPFPIQQPHALVDSSRETSPPLHAFWDLTIEHRRDLRVTHIGRERESFYQRSDVRD